MYETKGTPPPPYLFQCLVKDLNNKYTNDITYTLLDPSAPFNIDKTRGNFVSVCSIRIGRNKFIFMNCLCGCCVFSKGGLLSRILLTVLMYVLVVSAVVSIKDSEVLVEGQFFFVTVKATNVQQMSVSAMFSIQVIRRPPVKTNLQFKRKK